MDFHGTVVLVTGGSRGIGRAVAEEFAARGATVAVQFRADRRAADATLAALAGGGHRAFRADLTDPGQARSLIGQVLDELGRIDVLVNNAAGNFVVKAEDLSPNGWRAVVGIVLDGSFLCSRAAGRRMIEQGEGGAILSVIASYAWTGGPGTVHSAAAKAGILALTRTLAVEWAPHKIRVNCICPGPTDTEGAGQALWPTDEDRRRVAATVPLGRLATPEEVAAWAAALCSPYADYITGENLTIDGGHWLEQESYLPALGKSRRDG
jgi:NAD(P)-dependent dehydrogenase (short-subunit alcohol dehydrogenase family)